MFDFLKPKKEPLFTIYVELDPYNQDNLNYRAVKMSLRPDGTAYNGRYKVGTVKKESWNYIKQFDTPKEMKRESFNQFSIEVGGEIDRSKIFPDPHDQPYIYKCGETLFWPYMIPNEEYYCDMVDQEDHFDIVVDGKKIGTLEEKEGRDRISKLRRMLKTGFQATAQISVTMVHCYLFLVVRKV